MPSNVVPIESGEMEGLLGIVMTTTGYHRLHTLYSL